MVDLLEFGRLLIAGKRLLPLCLVQWRQRADDRLEAVIPNCPVVTPATMLDDWFPANKLMGLGLRMSKISRDELKAGLSYHSPLNYRPLVPQDRRMIITGLGDRMAPPGQAVMLWEHWDHCRLHWFPGNHVLHFNRGAYLEEMLAFMRGVGFAA